MRRLLSPGCTTEAKPGCLLGAGSLTVRPKPVTVCVCLLGTLSRAGADRLRNHLDPFQGRRALRLHDITVTHGIPVVCSAILSPRPCLLDPRLLDATCNSQSGNKLATEKRFSGWRGKLETCWLMGSLLCIPRVSKNEAAGAACPLCDVRITVPKHNMARASTIKLGSISRDPGLWNLSPT